ncbi:MAG: hydantoinase B/oxoprolinase family protein [Acidimicrobiales bacterium]
MTSDSTIGVVELELLWARLQAIADEMQSMLVRTVLSTVIRINLDCATAVFDQDGTMLAQPTSCAPGQIAAMPRLMSAFLAELEEGELLPGDVFVTSDPWIGSGHTPDVYIVSPVFEADRLVAFVATAGHQIDFGGRVGPVDSVDVFEEGLLLPVSRLYRAGARNDELWRIIGANVRMREKILHDLEAQVACNELGRRRLKDLMLEFSLNDLRPVARAIVDTTESAMRRRIAEVGDFEMRTEQAIEVLDEEGRQLRIAVHLQISGDEVVIDYAGTSAQVKVPVNCVYNYTLAYSVLGVKFALAPELPYNAGTQRPFTVKAPEGSILNARRPASVRWRITVGQQLPELMLRALTPHVPDRVIADCGSSPMWLWMFSGWDRRHGRFVFQSHFMGGLGARAMRDGTPTTSFPFNMSDTPVEVWENETPVLVQERRLITDSGGAGRHRGGPGQRIQFSVAPGSSQNLDGPLHIGLSGGRFQTPPQGLAGGGPGTPGRVFVDGIHFARPLGEIDVTEQTTVTMELPGGGGFGDPTTRDPAEVRRDVEDGLVSDEAARSVYGVVT